jgi:hypothetical protein
MFLPILTESQEENTLTMLKGTLSGSGVCVCVFVYMYMYTEMWRISQQIHDLMLSNVPFRCR